jgi:hypothetical protein
LISVGLYSAISDRILNVIDEAVLHATQIMPPSEDGNAQVDAAIVEN